MEEFILRSVGDQVTELQVLSKDVDTTVVVWGGRKAVFKRLEAECSCRCCFIGIFSCI